MAHPVPCENAFRCTSHVSSLRRSKVEDPRSKIADYKLQIKYWKLATGLSTAQADHFKLFARFRLVVA
jgi:hypothetical protein